MVAIQYRFAVEHGQWFVDAAMQALIKSRGGSFIYEELICSWVWSPTNKEDAS